MKQVILYKADKIQLIDSELFGKEQLKTKDMVKIIGSCKKTIIITMFDEESICRASRNIKNCTLMDTHFLPIEEIAVSDKVIITTGAMKKMEDTVLS